MERPGSMYETSKNYIASTISKQIGNALSVAESAVDHFLPPDDSQQKTLPATTNTNGDYPVQEQQHTHHHHPSSGHRNGGGEKTNGLVQDSSLGR